MAFLCHPIKCLHSLTTSENRHTYTDCFAVQNMLVYLSLKHILTHKQTNCVTHIAGQSTHSLCMLHTYWYTHFTVSARQTFTVKPWDRLCDQACKGSLISFMRYSKINNILAAAAQTQQNMQIDVCRWTYHSLYHQQIRFVSSSHCDTTFTTVTARAFLSQHICVWQWKMIPLCVWLLLLFLWFCTFCTKSWNCGCCHTHSLVLSFQPVCLSVCIFAKITHFQLKDEDHPHKVMSIKSLFLDLVI